MTKRLTMRFPDPYEHMTDAEFTRHMATLRQPQVPVGMRMPPTLLSELKAEARRQGVPYQTLAKHVLSEHLGNQRRRRARSRT